MFEPVHLVCIESNAGQNFKGVFEPMNRDRLSRVLRALLPAVAAGALWLAVAVPMASAAEADTSHVVKDGETLASIAADHGLTVTGLLALNPDLAGVVYVGQTLQVPGDIDPGQAPPVVCPLEIEVRAGDTLAALAAAHGIPAGTLALVNRLDPETVPAAGTRLCVPTLPEPASRIACEDAPQYVLQRTPPVTLMNASRTFPGGHQVCVETTWSVGGTERHWVKTEDGLSGWMRGDDVGPWQAYLASRNAPQPPPAPTATRRPTRTPTPVPTATPAAAVCRDAWGASAVAYRVRTGPGTQHAHTGKYVAAGQAVCELRRDRGWVQVRLADGTAGWVHGDGITNNQPTPTPIPTGTPTPVPSPTPTRSGAVAPAQTTASGIVLRHHGYDFAIDMPAGWVQAWSGASDELWEGEGSLRIRSYSQPAGTTLDAFARTIRDNARADWWEDASLFEIRSFEKRRLGDRDFYFLKYRVRESPQYCVLEVEEAIGLGASNAGPARGFQAQYRMCDWEGFEGVGRKLLDSFRVVEVPSYYGQYLDVNGLGIWVKAPGRVEPKALQAAADTIGRMLARIRPGIPACLAASGAELAIIPKGSYVYELPEFANQKDVPDIKTVSGLGGVPGQPVSSASEVNLLGLPGDPHDFVDVTIHEYAHAIMNLCFNASERAKNEELYAAAKQAGQFRGEYAMTNVDEFFAVFTTVYFDENSELSHLGIPRRGGSNVLQRRYPEIYEFMEQIYKSG